MKILFEFFSLGGMLGNVMGKGNKPGDSPTIILFVVGGITCGEILAVKKWIKDSGTSTQVTTDVQVLKWSDSWPNDNLVSSRLLYPHLTSIPISRGGDM